MTTVSIAISGMTGLVCVNSVRHALAVIGGVTDVRVTVGHAKVTFNPPTTNVEALRAAIRQSGYAPIPAPTAA